MKTNNNQLTASAEQKKIVIVSSRYHGSISERLEKGSIDHFLFQRGNKKFLRILPVSGAWETISATAYCAESKWCPDGIVVLGCVIDGATPHANWINNGITHGLAHIAAKSKIPIGFGILTCSSLSQALERSGDKSVNKGSEAMASVLHAISTHKKFSLSIE